MQKLDIKADCKECNAIDHYLCCLRSPDFVNACEAINDAPSIDIVRCKECRWGKPYSDKQLECDALGLGGLKFPDDFCSYGERREP